MTNIENKQKLIYISFHLILGAILFFMPFLSTYIGLAIIVFSTRMILSQTNHNEVLPLLFSAYIVGIEILLRMCNSSLFWEFGKYAVIYFIILGFFRRVSKINFHMPIFVYFFFLLPSIINLPIDSFDIWRQDVAFNLAGPACLTILSLYLFNIRLTRDEIINVLFFSILPILSMSVFIILRMPDIQSYIFTPYSDPLTSGGYGPNQVSTIFGFIISGIFICQLLKKNITGSHLIDLLCLILFVGLGLITFSRGGLFAAIISIVIACSFYFFHDQRKIYFFFKSILLLIATMATWLTIVSITEGAITKRYGFEGVAYNERLVLDLTGRVEILKIDLEIYYNNFLTGVGPGQGKKLRTQYGYGKMATAHTEYSRMLAEHGLLGLFALLIFIGLSIYYFFSSSPPDSKVIKILFGTLTLLTIFHSAMRIVMPCFAYALQFINLQDEV